MKVSRLIEKLKGMNQDLKVYVPKGGDDFKEYKRVKTVEDRELSSMKDETEFICVIIQ